MSTANKTTFREGVLVAGVLLLAAIEAAWQHGIADRYRRWQIKRHDRKFFGIWFAAIMVAAMLAGCATVPLPHCGIPPTPRSHECPNTCIHDVTTIRVPYTPEQAARYPACSTCHERTR